MTKKYTITFAIFFIGLNAQAVCKIEESTATEGGYRKLKIGNHKLSDVDSFKEFDGKIFYATSPIYGKPEVGVIDCSNDKRTQIVAPKNFDKSYPDGADFFRLKDVSKEKKNNAYVIKYFHVPDVDSQEFNSLENKKNLRSVKFQK